MKYLYFAVFALGFLPVLSAIIYCVLLLIYLRGERSATGGEIN